MSGFGIRVAVHSEGLLRQAGGSMAYYLLAAEAVRR